MITRLLTQEDRDKAKALWLSTFDDPPAFVDWFFDHRYLPEWSAGMFDEGKLISVIHGAPMALTAGTTSFQALMTSGVATVPSERGKGHMYAAMRFLQTYAQERGVSALFNHPQRPGAYVHLDFRPSTFTKYWQGEGDFSPGEIAPFSEEKAYQVYSTIADRYTGLVLRDRDAFHLKMEDYRSDGARGFLMQKTGETVGYCVYFDKEDVYGEEVLSLKEYGPILHELQRLSPHKSVSAKLPPDADGAGEIRAQNVMLASEDIWRAMEGSKHPCFCVDEY